MTVNFDVPKTERSQRTIPLAAKAIQILTARKPAVVNPQALVFASSRGTQFDRHNLTNKQLKPTCKRLNLVGVAGIGCAMQTQPCSMLSARRSVRCKRFSGIRLQR
jgi:hypothetical protein